MSNRRTLKGQVLDDDDDAGPASPKRARTQPNPAPLLMDLDPDLNGPLSPIIREYDDPEEVDVQPLPADAVPEPLLSALLQPPSLSYESHWAKAHKSLDRRGDASFSTSRGRDAALLVGDADLEEVDLTVQLRRKHTITAYRISTRRVSMQLIKLLDEAIAHRNDAAKFAVYVDVLYLLFGDVREYTEEHRAAIEFLLVSSDYGLLVPFSNVETIHADALHVCVGFLFNVV